MTNEEKQIVLRFALNMKACREAKGISQEKLAEYANLHRTFIGSIERGEKIPSLVLCCIPRELTFLTLL